MAKLFVANCTSQQQLVYYRLDYNSSGTPEENRRFQPAKSQPIPPGTQVMLGGDMHLTQIEDIVEQLSRYGAVAAKEVPRLAAIAPLVWNVDKSIPEAIFRAVIAHNNGVKIDQGKERRQKAAIVVNDLVANTVQEQLAHQGITAQPMKNFEIEYDQQDQSEAGESRIEEGYRVDPNAAPSKQQQAASSKRVAARRGASA